MGDIRGELAAAGGVINSGTGVVNLGWTHSIAKLDGWGKGYCLQSPGKLPQHRPETRAIRFSQPEFARILWAYDCFTAPERAAGFPWMH